jgi:hypothetical protein
MTKTAHRHLKLIRCPSIFLFLLSLTVSCIVLLVESSPSYADSYVTRSLCHNGREVKEESYL